MTHYAGPARVELSVATFANGVAKAAGLLRDGLGLAPGSTISVDLPLHWQLPVWALAALTVGGRAVRGAAWADARIVGPEGLAGLVRGEDPGADEVLACACDSFGLPIRGGVPAGVIDVGLEARAHPDVHIPEPDAHHAAALQVAGDWVAWADLAAGAAAGRAGGRLWVDDRLPDGSLLWVGLVGPLMRGASLVIGTHLQPGDAARIRATEGVTADVG